jgi:hydroxymethylglutaryl-CoA synthase
MTSGDDNFSVASLETQVSQQVAKKQYDEKVGPTTMLPKELGNMYCASLYAGLATLVHNKAASLVSTFVL